MSIVDMQKVATKAKSDPEFKRETRYLNGIVKVHIGPDINLLHFDNGTLLHVANTDLPDEQCKIVVRGTNEQWTELLAELPKPFYQCLQSTAVKHNLHLSNTNETFAYLPALNRLTVLMRNTHNEG
jgi:hypothetical protein